MNIFITLSVLCFVACLVQGDGSDENEKKASMFQVNDEWLSLPEVFSNLDFTADSTPASEEDLEGLFI